MEKEAFEMHSHLYGKVVTMDDRFESKHVWSEELALKNKGRWIPQEVIMEKFTLDSMNDNLIVKVKPIVHFKTSLEISGYKKELPITITADFTDVPEDQHEMFLQAFKVMYKIR